VALRVRYEGSCLSQAASFIQYT